MSKVTVFTIVLLLITVSSYGLYFKRNGHLSTPEDIKSFFDKNDETGDNDDSDDTNGTKNNDEEFDDIIKIGFMNPLTGPVEQYAAGFTYGAEEAINDLNEIYTDSGYTFELVEVDSGCDGTAAEAAAGALVDNGVWASGGAACSEASMGANAVLSAAGVPMISYASNNPILSNVSDYPDFFRIVPSEGLQAYAVADMMESMGVTSPAILYANFNDERLTLLADAIEKAWGTDNVCQKVGYQDLYATSEITQIADAGCDAIFIATLMHDVPFLLEEIDNQELDVMLFKNNGEAIDDIYYSLNEDTNVDGLYNIESRTATSYGDFEERYNGSGVEGIKQYVLTSYDSIMILGHAAFNFHNAQCETKTNCIFAIGNNYEGSSGLHTFLENGDVGGPGYDICYFTASNVSNIFYECNQYWTLEDGIQSLLEDEECDTPTPYSSSTTTQFELLEEDMLYTGVNASIIPSMTEGTTSTSYTSMAEVEMHQNPN